MRKDTRLSFKIISAFAMFMESSQEQSPMMAPLLLRSPRTR